MRREARVPLEQKVGMGVWSLANQETIREIGNIFGMSRGTAHTCIFQILTAIALHLKPIYIKWPNTSECRNISCSFEQQHGIADIIGCIDGTHIPVRPPAHDRDSYINRKGFPSVNVLAVCDNDKKFTFVYADRAGSVHDARVLRVSTLGHKLESGVLCKSNGRDQYILLGDSAYPLLPNLIVPYRDNGHLSQRQQKFNYIHSSARSVIERAFGRLKGTFRRLRGVDCTYPVNALKVIEAAFTLHNFILQHDYDDDDDVTYADMPAVEVSLSEDPSEFTNAAARKAAKDRRDQIADKLH